MPEVSVVIPAFRPRFLDAAIASVLAQTHRDFELLVSDDSDGDDVAAVVGKWPDPRIRYTRNPTPQVPWTNLDHVISLASGRYIKFLFDDDFLFPQSLEVLTKVARVQQAPLVFHARYFVDEEGVPTDNPMPVPSGQVATLSPQTVFSHMVGQNPGFVNFIGEPSSVLVDADRLRSLGNPFGIGDYRLRFLIDVALYLNMAAADLPLVGVGAPLSAFRRHSRQTCDVNSPAASAGMFEWELMNRWSADLGKVSADACRANIANLRRMNHERVGDFPELAAFIAIPPEPDATGRFVTAEFDRALRAGLAAVDARHHLLRQAA